MRRLVVPVALFAVVLLAAGSAGAMTRSDRDGTLSVVNGVGLVWIKADGAVIGRFDRGSVRISDPIADDGTRIDVWGADRERDITDQTTVYGGKDVRFRVVGGRFIIRAIGTDLDIAAVGQGRFALRGTAGTFSINGGDRLPLPDDLLPTYFDLGG